MATEPPHPGQFAFEGLERTMHEKARLGILTSLAAHPEGLLFNDLKQLCSLTDGNLNRHLRVLTEEGFVQIWKSQGPGRSQTRCQLTNDGRHRFLEYLSQLEQVVASASAAARSSRRKKPGLESNWAPT
jgi:predicted ArsR family transcriptional regulator